MATKAYLAKKDREKDLAMKDKEIAQREKESKRQAAVDIINGVTGNLTRLGSAGLSGYLGNAPKFAELAQKVKWHDEKKERSTKNDANWYKRWIDNVDRFVNLPQFNNVHVPERGMGNVTKALNAFTQNTATPGILSMNYIPYLGVQSDYNMNPIFPINIALARDISQIRKANSRSVSRNPDELGFYWLSAIEIATLLADLRCALSVVLSYTGANTYVPKVLLRSKGWDYDMIVTNRPLLIKLYQEFAARFNANIVIPSDYALLRRRVWLVSTIIKDANLRRGQLYTFNPLVYHNLNTDEDALTYQIASGFSSSGIKYSVSNLRTFLLNAFSVLEESVTMVDLVADIRSAIPAQKFATLPVDVDNEPYIFEANDEVLEQIHNMDTLPMNTTGDACTYTDLLSVTTDGTYLKTGYVCKCTNATAAEAASFEEVVDHLARFKRTLDSYNEIMVGDRILTSTRLKLSYWANQSATAPDSNINIKSAGTEIVINAYVWFYDGVQDTDTYQPFYTISRSTHMGLDEVAKITAFDWAPIYYIAGLTDSSNWYVRVFGELGNAFSIESSDLASISTVCIESENYLPDSVFTAAFGK